MTHAVIYDRASTPQQKDNYSRVNAREGGIRIAEQNGFTWECVKEIGSGTTLTGRPEMMRILDRIAAGEIQVIIVQDLDRLARPIERAIYETIRNICVDNDVLVYTHSGVFNFADDDSDFMADIVMSVSKKEVKRIRKRLKNGREARANSGGYFGPTPLGYKMIYIDRGPGQKPQGDWAIDPQDAKTIERIFDLTIEHYGNLSEVRRQLEGYTGKTGKPFSFNALKWIVTNQVYTGLMQYAGAEMPVHRPDLQIISFIQFQRVQELVKKRSQKHDFDGKRGRYILTGYVVCGTCGGKMVAQSREEGIIYACVARLDDKCMRSKSYSEKLILPAVIEIIADIINRYCELDNALNAAASQLGKTISEEAIEAAIRGELAVIKAGKERLINALTDGVFTQGEVSAKLEELRQREQDLKIELASINEKADIRDSFLKAMEALKSRDIRVTLTDMANERPLAFRQLLAIILKPNSLKVRTYRKPGTNRHWLGEVIDYELTEPIQEYVNSSFSKEILSHFTKDTLFFELAELIR